MKIKFEFRSRKSAVSYLEKRGWKLQSIEIGSAIMVHPNVHSLRRIYVTGDPVEWKIERI